MEEPFNLMFVKGIQKKLCTLTQINFWSRLTFLCQNLMLLRSSKEAFSGSLVHISYLPGTYPIMRDRARQSEFLSVNNQAILLNLSTQKDKLIFGTA